MAGAGQRAKTAKQFFLYNGKPLFVHSLIAFLKSRAFDDFVLVVPKGQIASVREMVNSYVPELANAQIVEGGDTRFLSLECGMRTLNGQDDDLVLVHDAARPFVNERMIKAVLTAAKEHKAAALAKPSRDAVAICKTFHEVDGYIPKSEVYLVETPQAFLFKTLKEAIGKKETLKREPPDEGSLVLWAIGIAPWLVDNLEDNHKITYPEDLRGLD